MEGIIVSDLRKSFKVARRQPGFWHAVGSLFHREYQRVKALDGVSFTIEPGELVGYIGPNGAGKSTTVKIMSGIMMPDSGTCRVMGRVPWRERIRHAGRIGVVFGQRSQLWWDVPAEDTFELLRDMYRVPEALYRRNRDELVDRLGLGGFLGTPVRQLSLGQRIRCELVASLLHDPDVLFLDEPTIGLDAVVKLAVRDFIREINRRRGVTVILTTHDLDDIEALCRRVLLIGKGRILYDGTLGAMRERMMGEKCIHFDLEESTDAEAVRTRLTEALAGLLSLRVDLATDRRLEVAFAPAEISAAAIIERVAHVCAIKDLTVENRSIEEVVSRLYRELSI